MGYDCQGILGLKTKSPHPERLSHKGSHFFIFVEKKEKILGTNRRHNSCNQQ
jgi:hypothetical protein